ncbi:MAG: ArsR/SmtB family transcription factor [Acidimicrobiia bacterium]
MPRSPATSKVTGLDACVPGCPLDSDLSLPGLREQLPNSDALTDTAELFRLLGDPTRLALLHALASGGELCVCDLAEVVAVSDNVVSQALRLLRTADIVRTRREGRRIHYRLADAHVRLLLDLSVDHVGHRSNHPSDVTVAGHREARRGS